MPESRWTVALRGLFLVAVLGFAWLGLRGRWEEIGAALGDTSGPRLLVAFAAVVLGLLVTGRLWQRLMSILGASLPYVDAQATFFVGQLGKYIPGSVWSIGAQADLARRYDVPARSTVTGGLLFLGYHVATAVALGAAVLLSGALDAPWPTWLTVVALGVALIGLTPPLVRRVAVAIATQDVSLSWVRTLEVLALMALAWLTYAVALVLLVPGAPWSDLAALGGAFAAAYAVGVLVVLAPAGVGARETVFVLLLTPLLGVGPATALALLARVLHTLADGALALVWWSLRRSTRKRQTGREVQLSRPVRAL
ncbi:uncharacterized membrane protein YbhN (UPF0104 family) [Marmoricola sp. OAE513]|uniref:lysylphosphatidylglycerol synthase domain-containing protein n=1 Tax=Marmoricola sp. OAE513 TaxID=2817894 RepID=UPI001AE15FA3